MKMTKGETKQNLGSRQGMGGISGNSGYMCKRRGQYTEGYVIKGSE